MCGGVTDSRPLIDCFYIFRLIDFFRYFSRDFSYNTGVASIRAGLIKKEVKGWQNDVRFFLVSPPFMRGWGTEVGIWCFFSLVAFGWEV